MYFFIVVATLCKVILATAYLQPVHESIAFLSSVCLSKYYVKNKDKLRINKKSTSVIQTSDLLCASSCVSTRKCRSNPDVGVNQ